MTKQQLSIFDMPKTSQNAYLTLQTIQRSNVLDVRTEGQKNNRVAFDVGETIGGSMKELAKNRERFLAKPSLQLLKELENTDVVTAAEVVVKESFFAWFTLENCREREVEPRIAKAMQLFIRRIPKISIDSPSDRRKYLNMLTFLSDLLRTIKTRDEYHTFEKRAITILQADRRPFQTLENKIEVEKEILANTNCSVVRKEHIRKIEEMNAGLFLYEIAQTMAFRDYPGPFLNYFSKHQSRVSALQNAFEIKSWDELIPPVGEKKSNRKGGTRKPVWERELPEVPMRLGGQSILIKDPKIFVEHFGFRATEFGHYVADTVSENHLSRSSEAFTDLADILDIPTKAVSLKGELAMAFGSRGRGRALGHYEAGRKVINLTRDRGSLGILAHEWFHGLDNFLSNQSYSTEQGIPGFITNQHYGVLPYEVIDLLNELLDAMKSGNATTTIDVRNTNSYTVRQPFITLYESVGGDLDKFIAIRLKDFDEKVENQLQYMTSGIFKEKAKTKYARQRTRNLRSDAEAVANYHLQQTGEKVDFINYPTDRSNYYQHAIMMDKGSVGKYWSSNVELAARAFECYIYEKLKEKNWTSDYLVCGIRDNVFPQELERDRIFEIMDRFVNAIRPLLS